MRKKCFAALAMVATLILVSCSRETAGDYKPSKRALELNNRAVRALAEKDLEQALRFVNDAIALEPEFYNAYANKAAILEAMGRSEEAAGALATVINMKPDYAEVYIPFGVLREKAGNPDEATGIYRKALDLYTAELAKNPASADAARNRAVALYLLKDRSQALTVLREILAKNPKDQAAEKIKNKIENGSRDDFIGIVQPHQDSTK
jgi:tetratricopeptide (TPR) repeat protein